MKRKAKRTFKVKSSAVAAFGLRALGSSKREFQGLDTFMRPQGVRNVVMESDEVTAVCPVTGQPDWYAVRIEYQPTTRCLESKSLKLYLHGFRNEGRFAESLANVIAFDVSRALGCFVRVEVTQKPRGGVGIVAVAVHSHEKAAS